METFTTSLSPEIVSVCRILDTGKSIPWGKSGTGCSSEKSGVSRENGGRGYLRWSENGADVSITLSGEDLGHIYSIAAASLSRQELGTPV